MVDLKRYPRLVPDSPEASRITNARIAEYVGLEDRGRPYPEHHVTFIRSAACDGFNVWLWSCKTDDDDVYVWAAADAKRSGLGSLATNFHSAASMTPEEYLKCLGFWPTRRMSRQAKSKPPVKRA